jgi:hypothetical protein
MIRARVRDGLIHPLDPMPAEWTDGHEVVVDDAGLPPPRSVEERFREYERLGPAEYEPGEWEEVQQILRQADEEAKAWVRREMGLD